MIWAGEEKIEKRKNWKAILQEKKSQRPSSRKEKTFPGEKIKKRLP